MLGGLSLGLVIAAVAYLAGMSSVVTPPVPRAATPTPRSDPAQPAPARSDPVRSADNPSASAGATVETQEETEEETVFEFYELLPRFEVVVPDVGPERDDRRSSAAIELDGSYVLQVGAFRALADADRMQARVALLGIESQIQRVVIGDDVFHRVRIGPLTELAQVNRVRRRLRDERIEYMLINVPD
jgi:cell division septation protein DedD